MVGRKKPFTPGEFAEALRDLGVPRGASHATIIRMCDAGLIECERRGPRGCRYIPARELTRVARNLRQENY